jgi:GrpB-like predicted nucleotidyltransferase (UPF0157 family)
MLRSKEEYASLFSGVAERIRGASGEDTYMEHVGATALASPVGKGDIDIYIPHKDEEQKQHLLRALESLYGQPANSTPDRVRFNSYVDGVEVEIQLVIPELCAEAVVFRDFLASFPEEARIYAEEVAALRSAFRTDLRRIKQSYVQKALDATRPS